MKINTNCFFCNNSSKRIEGIFYVFSLPLTLINQISNDVKANLSLKFFILNVGVYCHNQQLNFFLLTKDSGFPKKDDDRAFTSTTKIKSS